MCINLNFVPLSIDTFSVDIFVENVAILLNYRWW
jgi:hypothetical protein